MKKKLFLSAAFITAVIGVSASVTWEGHCGAKVTTVSWEYFETDEEAIDYYHELNEIYCGSDGEFTIRP